MIYMLIMNLQKELWNLKQMQHMMYLFKSLMDYLHVCNNMCNLKLKDIIVMNITPLVKKQVNDLNN